MHKSFEVEYCNLDLRFDRGTIHNFIKSLIQEGYSLYWSENEVYFTASIRTGRKLIKLKFQRVGDKFKLMGNYSFRDEKLVELMERMIGTTRGHAVVKRFRDRQIVIENIMFGEIIRMVEISGVEHKVVYQRDHIVTLDDIAQAYRSTRAEERIPKLREEIDEQLLKLSVALAEGHRQDVLDCRSKLEALRQEMLLLEM